TYETPRWGGFQVMGAFSAGNRANELPALDSDNNPRPRVISVGATYVNGPLGIGLAYERHNQFGAFQGAPGVTQELDDDAWGIAASYRFGPVRVGGTFLKSEYETGGGTEL